MAVNKVEFGDQVVMDITDSTVSPEKLLSGETAYDKSGAKITGSLVTKDISIETKRSTGENVATISLDNTDYDIYALSEEEVADFLAGDQEVSGNPVTLKTLIGGNAKSCSVDLLPIQDLHGYDSPWAGGAGKNKLLIDLATIKSLNSAGTWNDNKYTYYGTTFTINNDGTISCSENATNTAILLLGNSTVYPSGEYVLSGCPSGGGGSSRYKLDLPNSSYNMDTGAGAIFTSDGTTGQYIRLVVYNGYGNGLVFKPMICLSTAVNPDYAHFAPYENICPISGRTKVNLDSTGKNLCNGTFETDKMITDNGTLSGNQYHKVSDYIIITGNFIVHSPNLNVRTGGQETNPAGIRLAYYDKNKNFISRTDAITTTSIIGTLPSNAYYARLQCGGEATNVMWELGITATPYEPYNGKTVTVSFGQTVYSGTLDVPNGKLTIDKGIISKKLSQASSSASVGTTITRYGYLNTTHNFAVNVNNRANSICDKLYYDSNYNGEYAHFLFNSTGTYLYVYFPNGTEATTEFNVAYPLANPIELTLTPEEISLLKGNNTLNTDGDSIDITWQNIPDIEKLIGTTVTGILESGQTSLTLLSDKITEDSTLDIYTDKYGVNPTDITVTTGQAVLTFESQSTDLKVKVKVM